MGMMANGLNGHCLHGIICLNNSLVVDGAVSKGIGCLPCWKTCAMGQALKFQEFKHSQLTHLISYLQIRN